MKNYTKQLDNVNEIEDKTYYKDPAPLGFIGVRFPDIIVHSHSEGICVVTIGEDSNTQEITEQEALDYIDAQGGYSDTP